MNFHHIRSKLDCLWWEVFLIVTDFGPVQDCLNVNLVTEEEILFGRSGKWGMLKIVNETIFSHARKAQVTFLSTTSFFTV